MPIEWNIVGPPPPPGAPPSQRPVPLPGPPPTGTSPPPPDTPVGDATIAPGSGGTGVGAGGSAAWLAASAAPFVPGSGLSNRSIRSLVSENLQGGIQTQPNMSTSGRARYVPTDERPSVATSCFQYATALLSSAASTPNIPRGQQQQPSIAAVPSISGGSFKANAIPFVPGAASSSIVSSAFQGDGGCEILLPSDDDFTLGLTELSITAQGPSSGGVRPPPGPPPHYACHVGGGGGYHTSSVLPTGATNTPHPRGPVRHAALYLRPSPVASGQTLMSTRFASDQLQAELRQRAYLEQAQVDPTNEDTADLPRVLDQYHSLVPLEDLAIEEPSYTLGVRSGVLKGVSSVDGMAYSLRRIDHRQVIPSPELTAAAREAVVRWAPLIGHPNIAGLRGTFVSADMWDTPALYFAHDYHAGALSLETLHCADGEGCSAASELELWSYATQLCSALRAVHGAGLAAGGGSTLAPSKIILYPTGVAVSGGGNAGHRLRLAAMGIADVLRPEVVGIVGTQGINMAQRDDLMAAGQLLAALACGPTQVPLSDPVAAARHRCSQPLGCLISGLATDGVADHATFSQLLAPTAFDALEAERAITDRLQAELAKELENGRLLRLLIKMVFVNERPDDDMDAEWAETGDRYILKLFRDFVFHQHNDEGAPVMDWGHVFESLNKLDAGVAEKVLLLSRDEMSMLVASYADIKRCAEGAYTELIQASKMASTKARAERQHREMADRFQFNHR